MMLRKMLLVLVATMIVAIPALAADKPAQKYDGMPHLGNLGHGPAFTSRAVFEGFETSVPPPGWTAGVTVASNTWEQTTGGIEGTYCALVNWQAAAVQDETLTFQQTIDVGGGEYVLSFVMAGAVDTDWSLLDVETVEVNGTVVFDFDSSVTVPSFYWEQFFIDLSAYDGQTVDITFRYYGQDGESFVLDAVMVDDGTGWVPPPPPPPPANDTCYGAFAGGYELLPGFGNYNGDCTTALNDYPLLTGGCTDYTASGNDVVYLVCLGEGDTVSIDFYGEEGSDPAIYLIRDCAQPDLTCVAGADVNVDHTEQLAYTANEAGVYYFIISSYYAEGYTYVFLAQVTGGGCVVPNEDTSWGNLKSLYR